jgi:hypothetical protein
VDAQDTADASTSELLQPLGPAQPALQHILHPPAAHVVAELQIRVVVELLLVGLAT